MNDDESKKKLVYRYAIGIFIVIVVGWGWFRMNYTSQIDQAGFFRQVWERHDDQLKESVDLIKKNTKEVMNSEEAQELLDQLNQATSTSNNLDQ